MALTIYKKKRNFQETSEPDGVAKKSDAKLIFVVHRHKASGLHYDFRLELDGVLKSWAVPKGPSMNPKDKRLAMMVEDHPYYYKDFEGVIPEGNYGAGIVEIWDRGTYSDINNSLFKEAEKNLRKGLKSGDFKFKLFGRKLKGEFVLVKLKGKEDNSWLLIKHRDEFAIDEDYNSEAYTKKSSPINKWLSENNKPSKKSTKKVVNMASQTEKDTGELGRVYKFGKNEITVTHPDKIYFPKEKVTKGDVVNYYISIADYILPYLKGRPESLLRNPNGITAKGFFQKDAANDTPPYVHCKQVFSESTQKEVNYIVCDNIETLVYLNNLGCIEINPWHSTTKALDKPDYLMIDIDPSDKNTFEQVIEVALMVKKICDRAGADCYCKTSGASGMHVFVPTAKKYTFDQVKDFAYLVCMMVNEELKSFTTLERNLSKRNSKHIYLDYLQNRRGQTIASVYSLRPKPGATVSTPLLWEEVKPGLSPKKFTIYNTLERLQQMGDVFKGVLGKGINLRKCIENLE